MQLPGHNVCIFGSPGRELDRKEKNQEKENKKPSLLMFLGNLVLLLMARLWEYREPRHRTLVTKEMGDHPSGCSKEGARESKKAGSNGNNGTRDCPDVLYAVRGIR